MNDEKEKKTSKNGEIQTGKECAYLAVFVALVIAAQLALSVLPGIEVVTVLFVAYAFVFGWKRGIVAATAFTMLRQVIFGFFPAVFILYSIYYNFIAVVFGCLGKRERGNFQFLWRYILVACLCTVCFTLLDNVITPFWYGYSAKAAKLYFISSLPFMIPQTFCTAITVGTLFLPLCRVFQTAKRGLF